MAKKPWEDPLKNPWDYSIEEILATTDYWLEPAALMLQVSPFSDYADEFGDAKKRIKEFDLNSAPGFPLYDALVPVALNLQSSAASWLGHLQDCLDGVATELKTVVKEGVELDLEESARIDRENPIEYYKHRDSYFAQRSHDYDKDHHESRIAPPQDRVGSYSVERVTQGSSYYLNPGMPEAELNDIAGNMFPKDVFNIATYLDVAMRLTGHKGLVSELTKVFSGQWGDMKYFCQMLSNGETGAVGLSKVAMEAIGRTAERIDTHWQGYSANSAQQYFSDLRAAVFGGEDEIRSAARDIIRHIDDIKALADQIHELLLGIVGTVSAFMLTQLLGPYAIPADAAQLFAVVKLASDMSDIQGKIDLAFSLAAAANSGQAFAGLEDFVISFPIPEMTEV